MFNKDFSKGHMMQTLRTTGLPTRWNCSRTHETYYATSTRKTVEHMETNMWIPIAYSGTE